MQVRVNDFPGKFLLGILLFSTIPVAARAQSDPHAVAAVRAAVESQMHADHTDHSNWIYDDHDVNDGKDISKVCVGSPKGELCQTKKHSGVPLNADEAKAEADRIDAYVHSPSAQAHKKKNEAHDDAQARELLKMLPDAFIWTVDSDTPEYLTLSYRPDPSFDPPDMQSRVMCELAGKFVIVKKGNLIRAFTGELTQEVKIGFGILGRLNKGGHIDIERRDVGGGHWEITETHVHIGGHALFFKTIGTQEDEVKTNWRPSSAQNLQEAEDLLRTLKY